MPVMRTAAIVDLGSNAARMAVYAFTPGRLYYQVDQLKETLRLSRGADGIIRADAYRQGVEILTAFKTYCDVSDVQDLVATATSAVRDASNGSSFVASVREASGLSLEILTGTAEAEAGVLAVANSQRFTDALVLDVGGGSAQLSHMADRRFVTGESWPVGGVRMTEAFVDRDPPRGKAMQKLEAHVRAQAEAWVRALPDGLPVVGMGGTIRNLAKIQQKRDGYPISLLHGYPLRLKDVQRLCDEFEGLDLEARQRVSGLNEHRADVIVAAAHVVRVFLEMAGVDEVTVSGQGLREGLLAPLMWPDEPGHRVPDVRAFTPQNIVRRYYPQPDHNAHVLQLSLQLFDQLAPWHGYGAAERELLAAAAVMHDIGMAVEYFDHHKHGEFLVLASPMPGYTHREQALVALLVGRHRKGKVKTHGLDDLLDKGDEARIGHLGGMLRLAEYLERTKAQRVRSVTCHLGQGYLQVEVHAADAAGVEVQAANEHSDLLARSFDVHVEVIQGVSPE